jgi:multiple sugar transport system substrate-binding protein
MEANRRTRRRFVIEAPPLVVGGGAALAACAAGETTGAPPTPAGPPAVLTVAYQYGNAQREPWWRVVWDGLERELPQVRTELLPVTGSVGNGQYREKIVVELASGRVLDLMQQHYVNAGEFIFLDTLAPLDGYLGRDREIDLKDYPDGLLEPYRWQGKQYGLPVEVNVSLLYFNRQLFERFGVRTPAQEWQGNAWTVAKFLATARQMTRQDGERTIWGYAGDGTNRGFWGFQTQWLPFVYANGGDLFSRDQLRLALDDPRALEALQYIADLSGAHHVAPPFDSPEWGEAAQAQGRVAVGTLAPQGTVRFSQYDWPPAVVPNPSGPAGRFAVAGSSMWGVGAPSTQKDRAWQVGRWLATRGVQIWLDNGFYTAPFRKSMLTYPGWLRSRQPWEDANAWAEGTKSVRLPFAGPKFFDIMTLFAREWDRVLSGQATAREVIARIKPPVDQLLAESRPKGGK